MEYNKFEELWNIRQDKDTRGQGREKEFCNKLQNELKDILTQLGYDVEEIKREFAMIYGRVDFVAKLKNNKYIVIEVKTSNDILNKDVQGAYAIGQALTYKTVFSMSYSVPLEDIECMLILDTDSLLLHNVLQNNSLDIKVLVYGELGVKCYG